MNKRDEFLKSQKVLTTMQQLSKDNFPHITYLFGIFTVQRKSTYWNKHYVLKKLKISKEKQTCIAFCVDEGINAPNIFGVKGEGNGNLILDKCPKLKTIATKILLRYFKTL